MTPAEPAEPAEPEPTGDGTGAPSDGTGAEGVDPTPVAVIGLGAMGLPMATHLARTRTVTGYDPVPGRAQLAAGTKAAATPGEAVAGAGVVVLAVRTLEQVDEALFGPDGAVEALSAGAVVVLTSTVGADGARQVAERLAGAGAQLLDLPVSGGPLRAGTGDLLAFAGGPDAVIASVRPVLDRLASTIAVIGPNPGDGQAMKAVNQLLCGIHIAAAAEALALATGLGLDPQAALDTLGSGAAASFMLTNRGPRMIEALAGQAPDVLSRVDIFVKDMGIVADAGRGAAVALPVAAAAEQLYRLAAAAGLAASDDSTITTILSAGSRGTGD